MNTGNQNSTALSAEQKRALLAELLRKNSGDTAVAPASFPQQRLWLLDQLEPGNPTYNVPAVFRLTGSLDVNALSRSIREIQRRHESLRTTFNTAEGQPIQVIHRPTIDLRVVELSAMDDKAREAEALRLASVESQARFDLAKGPLFRASLLRLKNDDHFLLLMMHHIVSDGWSMSVLTRELTALYGAFAAGKPSPFGELPIQYKDFAARQQAWARTDDFRRQLSYWAKRLAGRLPILQLPADRPRPATPTYRGGRETFAIPAPLTASIRSLSRTGNATLFMTTVSAFYALLYRYTGQEDLLVGSFVANRNSGDVEGLIGLFVNTLVLRARVTGEMTFRQLLSSVRNLTVEAYDHQDVPFEKVVEEIQPERDLSVQPVFQITFSFQNMPPMSLSAPGLAIRHQNLHNGMSKFDLTTYMWDTGDATLGGVIEYNTDLFDASTIRRLLAHFEVLLAGAVSSPDLPIADLPLMADAEYQTIRKWNSTGASYPSDKCLQDLFREQLERTPEQTALISEGRRISYQELNRRASHIASELQKLGVRSGDRVCIFLGRSVDTVAAMIGVLQCGAAYVALDPAYPLERLRFMIADSRPAVLITNSLLARRIAEDQIRILCVDEIGASVGAVGRKWGLTPLTKRDFSEDEASCFAGGVRPHFPPTAPTDVAYVIYTSGSTGTPKGVLGLHRSTVNRLAWMWNEYPFQENEVCCHKTSLNFVDSVCEILSPLLAGVPLLILSETGGQDPEQLVRALGENGVTRIVLVPSLLRVLLDSYPDLAQRLPRLRFWVTSGEALSADLCRQFSRALPEATLVNLYGSSEVAADVTCYDTRDFAPAATSVPIGRPIANTQIWILDSRRRVVPIGVTGELYVGGTGLARGYLNRDDLTVERFVPDPFNSEADARLYKTGDLARYCADGNIEYLGRADHQVKIRGFRVEFAEVEAALRRHSAVRDVAVAVLADDTGNQLAAYVASGGSELTPDELHDFLKGILPDYMIPSAIMVFAELPRTPGGKVDRQALAGAAPASRKGEVVAPRTETERQLFDVWRSVLRVDRIGIQDNFFRMGGHSLAAAQMAARIRAAFHIELPLAEVFRFPTLESLAVRIEDAVFAQSDPEELKQLLNQIEDN